MISPAAVAAHPALSTQREDAPLRQAARELEAAFLAEMLRAAGVGQPRASFGGGAGEDQFASFLARAQADALAARGGIGLSEAIFNALRERGDDDR